VKEMYLDMAATAPLRCEAREAMIAAMDEYGNPSSLHTKGLAAERLVEEARREVERALGFSSGVVYFTGSGTESNNWVFRAVFERFFKSKGHVVVSAVEHPAVWEPAHALKEAGFDVTVVGVNADGDLALEQAVAALRQDTVLVSVMEVNNETGALFPVEALSRHLRQHSRALLHVDGTQAFCKMPSWRPPSEPDFYTVSAHKIGGPKGVAALYARKSSPLKPMFLGGGQEQGLRSGTENVLGIVGFGAAAKIARTYANSNCLAESFVIHDAMVSGLEALGCRVARPMSKSPYIVTAAYPGIPAEVMVHALAEQGIYVSTGSACSSRRKKRSTSHRVLAAMGWSDEEQQSAFRLSFDAALSEQDVTFVLATLRERISWILKTIGRS
jgi:cysteine desulfurase